MAVKLNRIIQGDCIEKLGMIEAGTIDLAFADPPFNIGYDYDEYDDKRSCEDYIDWSKRWMTAITRVLKSTGALWLAIGDEYAAELKVLATRELGHLRRGTTVTGAEIPVRDEHVLVTHLAPAVKELLRRACAFQHPFGLC